jgi:hypothetical protein
MYIIKDRLKSHSRVILDSFTLIQISHNVFVKLINCPHQLSLLTRIHLSTAFGKHSISPW